MKRGAETWYQIGDEKSRSFKGFNIFTLSLSFLLFRYPPLSLLLSIYMLFLTYTPSLSFCFYYSGHYPLRFWLRKIYDFYHTVLPVNCNFKKMHFVWALEKRGSPALWEGRRQKCRCLQVSHTWHCSGCGTASKWVKWDGSQRLTN